MVKDVKMLKAPIVLIASLNISNLVWALDGQLFSARVPSKAFFLWLMWSKLSEKYPVAFEAKPWFSFCFPVKIKTQPEQKKIRVRAEIVFPVASFVIRANFLNRAYLSPCLAVINTDAVGRSRWVRMSEWSKVRNGDQRKRSDTKMLVLLLIKEVWADILTLMFSPPGQGVLKP